MCCIYCLIYLLLWAEENFSILVIAMEMQLHSYHPAGHLMQSNETFFMLSRWAEVMQSRLVKVEELLNLLRSCGTHIIQPGTSYKEMRLFAITFCIFGIFCDLAAFILSSQATHTKYWDSLQLHSAFLHLVWSCGTQIIQPGRAHTKYWGNKISL